MRKIKVFAILNIMVLAGLFYACNNDNYNANNQTDQFNKDLAELRRNQQETISGLRTRNSGGMTDEDIQNVAAALDSILQTFIVDHRNEFVGYLPDINLDEDEVNLLIVDKDAFLAFVQENFSNSLYNELYARTHASSGYTSSIDRGNMNPLELVISSSYETFDDFCNLVAQETDYMVVSDFDTDDLEIINGENQKPYKNCDRQKNMEMNQCAFIYYTTNLIGIIAGFSAGGIITAAGGGTTIVGGALVETQITTIASVVALSNYLNCIKNAEANYKLCKETK